MRLVWTPFSWELQTFSLSEKGPRRSKLGAVAKTLYGVVIHYCSEGFSKASARKIAQNEGHEKATKKSRKTPPKHCFSKQMRATEKPRKSHEKVTSKNVTSNENSSKSLLNCCYRCSIFSTEGSFWHRKPCAQGVIV